MIVALRPSRSRSLCGGALQLVSLLPAQPSAADTSRKDGGTELTPSSKSMRQASAAAEGSSGASAPAARSVIWPAYSDTVCWLP